MKVHGFVSPEFESVRDEFARNFTDRADLGAAFAVYRDGLPVIDLWAGFADRNREREWQEDTLQVIFSGTKGLVAVCILLLLERRLLRLDAPVAHYWPEFAAAGKENVLVSHVVSHRSGLPGIRTAIDTNAVLDDVRMAALLAEQEPFWPAGAVVCYHPFTFGWLCGELIRRVDGRSIGKFFQDEVARPLGLEIWIGLPPEQEYRVASLCRLPEPPAPPPLCAPKIAWSIDQNPPLLEGEPRVWNTRSYHAAEIAGAGGIGSARSIARLYGCLSRGGELEGFRLLEPETIALARRSLAEGRDPCFDWPFAFGVGFALQAECSGLGSPTLAFGHGGAGGSVHGAWPDERVGFSYCMNQMREGSGRSDPLLDALYRSLR